MKTETTPSLPTANATYVLASDAHVAFDAKTDFVRLVVGGRPAMVFGGHLTRSEIVAQTLADLRGEAGLALVDAIRRHDVRGTRRAFRRIAR